MRKPHVTTKGSIFYPEGSAASTGHRTNGPCYVSSGGVLEYWVNSRMHRGEGPAAYYPRNGLATYWYDDKVLTTEEFNRSVLCRVV